MKYKKSQFIILLVALVTFHATISAQGIGDRNRAADGGDGRFGLQGRVILPNGKPAVGAKISISSAENPSASANTNMDGVFQVGGLRAGNYTVAVRVPGMPVESEMLTIDRDASPGRTFNLVIHMRAEGQPKADPAAINPLLKDVPKEALEKFKKGQDKLQKNDYKAAVVLFDEATKSHPTFAAAYYEKGSAQLKDKDLDGALESFVKAVSIKQDYLEAKYSVGFTQFQKKNYEVAAAVFDDVVKQKRDMPEAHMYLGISLYNLKNIDAAEASLRSAIAVRDGESIALAHRFLGGIYIQKKKNSEAAAELQKYLDLVPKAPDADKLRATIEDLKKKS
jgi:Flp pilus assembly protein TadD